MRVLCPFWDNLFRVAFLKQILIWVCRASLFDAVSRVKSRHVKMFGGLSVPLTERVDFKTRLQRGNRVQLPKLVRWRYKLESDQVLKVTVSVAGTWGGFEPFYGRMDKSGRLTIPRLTLQLLQARMRGEPSMTGTVMEVWLDPV